MSGGYGPGSYYFPVMIQFIFVFPVVYFVIKKYDFYGLIICGITNFIYEILQHAYGMNPECYRLLIFRYILVIAFGSYLVFKTGKIKRNVGSCSFVIGLTFIILYKYLGYSPKIIVFWTGTSFISCLFIMPVSLWLITSCKLRCRLLELVGRSSYNIFLVQMLYYQFVSDIVYSLADSRILEIMINMIVCLLGGIIFYYIESPITRFIVNKVNTFFDNYSDKDIWVKINRFFYV